MVQTCHTPPHGCARTKAARRFRTSQAVLPVGSVRSPTMGVANAPAIWSVGVVVAALIVAAQGSPSSSARRRYSFLVSSFYLPPYQVPVFDRPYNGHKNFTGPDGELTNFLGRRRRPESPSPSPSPRFRRKSID